MILFFQTRHGSHASRKANDQDYLFINFTTHIFMASFRCRQCVERAHIVYGACNNSRASSPSSWKKYMEERIKLSSAVAQFVLLLDSFHEVKDSVEVKT